MIQAVEPGVFSPAASLLHQLFHKIYPNSAGVVGFFPINRLTRERFIGVAPSVPAERRYTWILESFSKIAEAAAVQTKSLDVLYRRSLRPDGVALTTA